MLAIVVYYSILGDFNIRVGVFDNRGGDYSKLAVCSQQYLQFSGVSREPCWVPLRIV